MNLQRVSHSTGWSWADEICLQWVVVVVVVERWQVDFLFQNLWSFIHWSDRRINSGRFGRRFGDTAQDIISCAFNFKCRLDWCIRGRIYCRATIAIRLARHFIMTIIIENILAFCLSNRMYTIVFLAASSSYRGRGRLVSSSSNLVLFPWTRFAVQN